MKEKFKDLFEVIGKLSAPKLKEYWSDLSSWEDKDILEFRDKFMNLQNLLDLHDTLGERELVYIDSYDSSMPERFILPFIGRIEDIDELVKLYLPYDNLIKHYLKKDPAVIKTVENYVTGAESYRTVTENNKLFFIRLIGDRGGDWRFESQVQIYSFDLEEILLKAIKKPWFSELDYFVSEEPLKRIGFDDFIKNANQFIYDRIDTAQVYGLDRLNQILGR